jgi:hypothetical protein
VREGLAEVADQPFCLDIVLLGRILIAMVVDRDRCPRLCQCNHNRPADPAVAAGDDRRLVL